MLRHGLAALVVLALAPPLAPLPSGAMACCRGGGAACACPIEAAFSGCPSGPFVSQPQAPALLAPAPPAFEPAARLEELVRPREALRSPARRPLTPPPRP